MKQALGLTEVSGLSTAVVAADATAKAANIRILETENAKGLRYTTIKIVGDVGAVNAAVNAGKQIGAVNDKPVLWKVTPEPSDCMERVFCCPEPPVPPSPPTKEAQEETGIGKTGETMRESPETAGEPELDGGQIDSVRGETDSKDGSQAEAERPSEEEDSKLAGRPRKASRCTSAVKGTDTVRSKNS